MQLMPGQYSRGPPVTNAHRGEPSLAVSEVGTGGGSSEEDEVIWARHAFVADPREARGAEIRDGQGGRARDFSRRSPSH